MDEKLDLREIFEDAPKGKVFPLLIASHILFHNLIVS